jgi:hypothetical protein
VKQSYRMSRNTTGTGKISNANTRRTCAAQRDRNQPISMHNANKTIESVRSRPVKVNVIGNIVHHIPKPPKTRSYMAPNKNEVISESRPESNEPVWDRRSRDSSFSKPGRTVIPHPKNFRKYMVGRNNYVAEPRTDVLLPEEPHTSKQPPWEAYSPSRGYDEPESRTNTAEPEETNMDDLPAYLLSQKYFGTHQ